MVLKVQTCKEFRLQKKKKLKLVNEKDKATKILSDTVAFSY